MKKICLCLCIVLIVTCFSACGDLIDPTTTKYKNYLYFYEHHKPGMEKQAILEKLGCPKSYVDTQGKRHNISDWRIFEENISSDCSTAWLYTCYKYSDPRDGYLLTITFNAEGKSAKVEFVALAA